MWDAPWARRDVVDSLIAEVGQLRDEIGKLKKSIEELESRKAAKVAKEEEQAKMPRTITSGKWPQIQRKLEIADLRRIKPGA